MAQTSQSIRFFKNKYLTKETNNEKALFSETITTSPDGTITTEVRDIKKNEVIESKSFKGDEAVGIWIIQTGSGTKTLDYNFSVTYSKDSCSANFQGIHIDDYFTDIDSIKYVAPRITNGTSVPLFIMSRVMYPERAIAKRLQGTSTIFFTINTEGRVENIRALEGSNIMFDKEAIRVIKLLTFIGPATLNGNPQSICIKQRIKFTLS